MAGDSGWIAPSGLVELGLLERGDLPDHVTPPVQAALLAIAWDRYRGLDLPRARSAIEPTLDSVHLREWLNDWGLYSALRQRLGQAHWIHWPQSLATRDAGALAEATRENRDEIAFHIFAQALFRHQWGELRRFADQHRVLLFGDIPIYVAHDSVDAWRHRSLFQLDGSGHRLAVAGAPPDDLNPDGQVWGLPLYDWPQLAATDYRWWIERIRVQLERFDLLRIDHFRGLAEYWEVPAEADTAAGGRWRPGPRAALFDALSRELGPLPLVAEDLGVITDDVEALRNELQLPGMRVLQFALGEDSPHRPDRIQTDHVVYTGTHDTPPARAWYRTLTPDQRRTIRHLTGGTGYRVHRDLATAALRSPARLAMLPLQDVLGLGPEGTMNRPGTSDGNWQWVLERWPAPATTRWLTDLTRATGRAAT
jgi:4-alpha-glucanotransferase